MISFVCHFVLLLKSRFTSRCDGRVWEVFSLSSERCDVGFRCCWSCLAAAPRWFCTILFVRTVRSRLNFSTLALGFSTPSPGHRVSARRADCLIWLLTLCLFRRRRRGGACPGDRLHMQPEAVLTHSTPRLSVYSSATCCHQCKRRQTLKELQGPSLFFHLCQRWKVQMCNIQVTRTKRMHLSDCGPQMSFPGAFKDQN